MFSRITGIRKLFGCRQGINKAWIGTSPYVLVSNPSTVEVSYRIRSYMFVINSLIGVHNLIGKTQNKV